MRLTYVVHIGFSSTDGPYTIDHRTLIAVVVSRLVAHVRIRVSRKPTLLIDQRTNSLIHAPTTLSNGDPHSYRQKLLRSPSAFIHRLIN